MKVISIVEWDAAANNADAAEIIIINALTQAEGCVSLDFIRTEAQS